jgi:hypothetical protein
VTRGKKTAGRSKGAARAGATQVPGRDTVVLPWAGFTLETRGETHQVDNETRREASNRMSILWIILIVILVLALLGFFSRGRW